MTLDTLMFTREHFPVVLHEATGYKGKRFWDFSRIEIPPYHPTIGKDGISFESVPCVLCDVVEETVRDLEEIADKRSDVQVMLSDVVKDRKTGRVLFEAQITEQNSFGITINSVPIVEHFYLGRKKINPYDYHGDG